MRTDRSLLPPNARPLERALEAAGARIGAVPIAPEQLWDPMACPIELLPWLAWALSIDRWETSWSEPRKRQAVAVAIELQRHKGTPASIEAVLASFDELLRIVEWFETTPRGAPHTFEVILPIGGEGGERTTSAFAEAIVRDVIRYKPARSHFRLVQSLRGARGIGAIGAARALGFVRAEATAAHDPDAAWDRYLQTETGEPLRASQGGFLEE
ncbi:MAG: phage tail protein I [Allosphingosinicella sp.]|uniref:phage tail protein I n=1 Tax=Allosphingosinicella sp. TaxID=2823234 RepID=UPI00392658E6